MFNNVGGSIKTIAAIVCWIGIIISFLCGITIMSADSDAFFPGLLVMGCGSLASWLGSLMTYGIGEAIEDIHAIRIKYYQEPVNTTQQQNTSQTYTQPIFKESAPVSSYDNTTLARPTFSEQQYEQKIINAGGWKCKCGNLNAYYVGSCGCGLSKSDCE